MMLPPQLKRLGSTSHQKNQLKHESTLSSNQVSQSVSYFNPRKHFYHILAIPSCFTPFSGRSSSGFKELFMASLLHPSETTRRKKTDGQQKREVLEKEVATLQNILNQEEQMHHILEQVHHRHDGSAITIPNYLPPKTKELLAELAMVESEIARLETQISQLKLGLKHEQEANKQTKPRVHWQPGTPSNNIHGISPKTMTNSNPINAAGGGHERMAFETRALHFISKAIKGDFNSNHDLTLAEKRRNSRLFSDQKENQVQVQNEEPKFQERVPKKSGMLTSPSPMRDPRHPTPKPRERHSEISLDPLPKSLANAILSEENIQQWQPNKLSEDIIKYLNFIYIRLLRTSRAMELEKWGPISRSMNTSSISRSFRAETNLKSSLVLQKEAKQQDPYGIFNSDESIPRDIGPYKNLVIFTSSSMDPKYISSSGSLPLLTKLRDLMSNLQTVDLRFLTNQQKLAFWINIYNACIMHGFIQYGVPSTPERLQNLMNKATLNIGGNSINAQAIEHFILRKPASASKKERTEKEDHKEALVRKLYGLESMNPNVTFSLCCGTRSSPAVRVYTAEGVVAELERSKLEYLQASIVVTSTKRIAFPELLFRHKLDFAVDMDSLVDWVCQQLPTSGSLRKSIVECFRGANSGKLSNPVEKIPYDTEFQYLLAI